MTTNVKTVAVIGAGVAGLASIKCCIDEGLEPACFEKTHTLGGLWAFDKNVDETIGCTLPTTISNISKEFMIFSDFPQPAEFPVFLPRAYAKKYLDLYAEKFKLTDHIQYGTEVIKVAPAQDHETSGKWEVVIKRGSDYETKEFDAVMLATGHLSKPKMPDFEGGESFRGKQMHSHYYREGPFEFSGQRVLVVGTGDTGVEIASEIGPFASQVYLSTRRGFWVHPRNSDQGVPYDMVLVTRYTQFKYTWFPRFGKWLRKRQVKARFNHAAYGIEPKHDIEEQFPAIQDAIVNCILTGRVKIKPDIRRITPSGVEFVDGTEIDDIDVIIYATGYDLSDPVYDDSVVSYLTKDRPHLYRFVFPPERKHPTFAVIGFIQPNSSSLAVDELQARWATRVFKGDLTLPPAETMKRTIQEEYQTMDVLFYRTDRFTIAVDYMSYMDAIAAEVGCAPNLGSLFLKSPSLAFRVFFGPKTPVQYRLQGPGKWSGARHAIENTWTRVAIGMTGKPRGAHAGFGNFVMFSWEEIAIALVVAICILFLFIKICGIF